MGVVRWLARWVLGGWLRRDVLPVVMRELAEWSREQAEASAAESAERCYWLAVWNVCWGWLAWHGEVKDNYTRLFGWARSWLLDLMVRLTH